MTPVRPSRLAIRLVWSSVAAFACVVALHGQQGQAQAPQQPQAGRPAPPVTFKVEVNYVEVDAVVLDIKGVSKQSFPL